jgi:hypothetical protein
MPKRLDPKIAEVLKTFGYDQSAVWDCHGTWVVLHKYLEQIAAKAGIRFDTPTVIEASSKDRIVAVCVTGHMGDKVEWSFGEAAPGNNKNSYPYAMAEKRAKDRVILKLIGLYGFVYGEDEADDFKETIARADKPQAPSVSTPDRLDWDDVLEDMGVKAVSAAQSREPFKVLQSALKMATTEAELAHFAHENAAEIWRLSAEARHHLREAYNEHMKSL